MFTRISFTLIIFSVSLFAQYSTTHGNLLKIPIDATQINPADTMGSWINYHNSWGDGFTRYKDIIHNPQTTFFEKFKQDDYTNYGLVTELFLEDFANQTSDSYGSWPGYYDITEPYVILNTHSYRIENGTWLMNGVYNMAFLSDDDKITILPKENYHDLVYISTKINDKYLTVFRKNTALPEYDFYMLDLSGSPEFDTTGAERMYFDIPAAPYKMRNLSGSLYIAGIDSMPDMYPRLCLFSLQGDTFQYIKTFLEGINERWEFRNDHLFFYDGTHLYRYEYNPADTSFINETVIAAGVVYNNEDFTISAQYYPDSLFIYDNDNAQMINTIDISGLWNPFPAIVDSPYIYIHQTTFITDVKDESAQSLNYQLQVYPNPFNPATNIVYSIPYRGRVEIKLYSMLGREIRNLYSGEAEGGDHQLTLDGSDLASGIYFISLRAQEYFKTQKIILLK